MIAGEENRDSSSLGSWLRDAREARGESLDDVSKVTRIGRSYLAAIEQDDLDKLPRDAYARGFIRLYAKYLGLSGDEAVLRMEGKSAPAPAEKHEAGTDRSGTGDLSRLPAGPAGRRWAVPLFLILLVIAFAILLRPDRAAKRDLPQEQPHVAATDSTAFQNHTGAKPKVTPAGEAVPANKEIPPNPGETQAAKGIVLRLKAVQNGKLHITMDGAVSQEYDLNVGDLVEWKAEKVFILDLDNAGSVEGEVDGSVLPPFGKTGEAAHLVIRSGGVSRE